ncbi:MAG: hypothetical protein JSR80_07020 [Verrucomicrobia bacterium]|nr:hypothetical protein [Verrucomicrobiota bacterium]
MRYALTALHHHHFQADGWIVFEGLINSQEAEALELGPIRDGWRTFDAVRKIACSRPLGEIAAELLRVPTLRLAFTERLEELPSTSLQERSCIQGLLGALLINLQTHEVVVINPLFPLDQLPKSAYFLIAYASERACYVKNEKDPFTHLLKERGMVFGDPLNEGHHPLVYRR